ncbi:hypothetical protein FO519_001025 [Halicephalobus sp. NKZ332]|nr:hypothetical protein FO519_001025 [Halicephalobus sp. NKZ332]
MCVCNGTGSCCDRGCHFKESPFDGHLEDALREHYPLKPIPWMSISVKSDGTWKLAWYAACEFIFLAERRE